MLTGTCCPFLRKGMIPNTQIQVTGQVQALENPLEQGPSPNSRPDFTFPSVYSFSSRGPKLLSLSLSATKVHKVRASLTADPSLAPDFENSHDGGGVHRPSCQTSGQDLRLVALGVGVAERGLSSSAQPSCQSLGQLDLGYRLKETAGNGKCQLRHPGKWGPQV